MCIFASLKRCIANISEWCALFGTQRRISISYALPAKQRLDFAALHMNKTYFHFLSSSMHRCRMPYDVRLVPECAFESMGLLWYLIKLNAHTPCALSYHSLHTSHCHYHHYPVECAPHDTL